MGDKLLLSVESFKFCFEFVNIETFPFFNYWCTLLEHFSRAKIFMFATEWPGPLKCSPIVFLFWVRTEVLCSENLSFSCLVVYPMYICLQLFLLHCRQYATLLLVQLKEVFSCTTELLKGPLNCLVWVTNGQHSHTPLLQGFIPWRFLFSLG